MAQPYSYVVAFLVAATRHGLAYLHAADGLYLTESKDAAYLPLDIASLSTLGSHPQMLIARHRMDRFRAPLARLAQQPSGAAEGLAMTLVAPCSSLPMAISRPAGCPQFLASRPQQAQFLEPHQPSDGECRPGLQSHALRSVATAAGLLRQITWPGARVASLFIPLRLHSWTFVSRAQRRGNFVRRVGTGRAHLSAGAFRPLEPWTIGG